MRFDDIYGSRFLKAADLGGKPRCFTITSIKLEQVGDDEKLVVSFKETKKALPLNKINAGVLRDQWGQNPDDCVGKQIILKPDKTDLAGKRVDCIRIVIPATENPAPVEPEQGDEDQSF